MARDDLVLVTGGAGLLGSHVIEVLLEDGARVRTVQHQRPLPFGKEVEVVAGDLLSSKLCERAVQGVDAVVHAAGVSGGLKKVSTSPFGMVTDSLLINTQLLEAARKAGVPRYVFMSSASVYPAADKPLAEDAAWNGPPENAVGAVKRMGEAQAQLYAHHGGMELGIVRGGGAYGPRDNYDLETSHVVPALIRKAVERQAPIKLWGTGRTLRDFTHARDVARGAKFVLDRYMTAQPLNIATGRAVTIRDLLGIILDAAGYRDARVEFEASQPEGSLVKLMDTGKARSLGFRCELTLEEGIRQTVAWYRQRPRRAAP